MIAGAGLFSTLIAVIIAVHPIIDVSSNISYAVKIAGTVIVSKAGALGMQGLKDVPSQVEAGLKAGGVAEAFQYWTELTTAV